MLTRVILAISLIAAVVATGGGQAWAAADRSELLIKEGVELRKKGQHADALSKFQGAYELAHSARAAAQLGLCEAALEKWADADAHLAEALLSSDVWIERNRQVLESTVATVRSHLVNVEVAGNPPGVLVRVNGEAIGKLPTPQQVRVLPGQVEVVGTLSGHAEQRETRSGRAGQTLKFELSLKPQPMAAREPVSDAAAVAPTSADVASVPQATSHEPADVEGTSWKRTTAYVAGALALGTLGLGVASHIQREGATSDFANQSCGTTTGGMVTGPDLEACESIASRFDSARTRMTIGYVGAGVFTAVAVTLWLLDGKSTGDGRQARAVCGPSLIGLTGYCAMTF